MEKQMESKLGSKLLSCAVSAALVVGLAPAFVAPAQAVADDNLAAASIAAQADDANNTQAAIEDGAYLVDVDFSCYFEMSTPVGAMKHDMSSVLASSKALVSVSNGMPSVKMYFKQGDYALNGIPRTTVNLSDVYTPHGATASRTVDIAVSKTQNITEAEDGTITLDDAVKVNDCTFDRDDAHAIRTITFDASPDTSTYYLQTGVDGGMGFPYKSSQGNMFYATINIDWSSGTSAGYGTSGKVFEYGKMYAVPMTVKNASNLAMPSMMAKCLSETAILSVSPEGVASIATDVKPATVGSVTAYAKDFKVYKTGSYDADSKAETEDATVLETVSVDGSEYPSRISIPIPSESKDLDGAYINVTVGAMGMSPDAFISLDYANAADLIQVEKPTAATDLVYTGAQLMGVAAGTGYTLTNNTATDAGSYRAIAKLADGYVWSDGTTAPVEVAWSIEAAKVAKPTAATGLVYTGSALTGVKAGTGYTLTGNTATDAGSYKATATLAKNYTWADGTTTAVSIDWAIAKKAAKPTLTVTPKTKTLKAKNLKKKKLTTQPFTMKTSDGATVTYSKVKWSKNSKRLTLNTKTGKITVKKKTKKGTYKIKVKATAASANLTQPATVTKTFTVKVK